METLHCGGFTDAIAKEQMEGLVSGIAQQQLM